MFLTPRGNRMVLGWNHSPFSQEKRKDINGNFCSLIIRYHRVLVAGLWDFLVALWLIVYIQKPEYSGNNWSNFICKGFQYSKTLFGFQSFSLNDWTFSLPSNSAEARITVWISSQKNEKKTTQTQKQQQQNLSESKQCIRKNSACGYALSFEGTSLPVLKWKFTAAGYCWTFVSSINVK